MHFRVVFCGLQWQGECCGLDMKGTPKGPRVWIWSPAVVPPRKVVDPSGGGVSLEEVSPRWVSCFIDQSHVLFTFCFLIANVTWPASCFSPWPQFCSSRHAFSYCCRAEWAVLPELEASFRGFGQVFWHNKRKWTKTDGKMCRHGPGWGFDLISCGTWNEKHWLAAEQSYWLVSDISKWMWLFY